MRLKKIELNNFGSYREKNVFNITINDSKKQIVIIGGKNGAGKTTLFTAIELCLYGHYSFGYKNAGKIYTKKVFTLINDQARLDDDGTAYVSLDFSDSSNGDLDNYSIQRNWSWEKGEVKETFQATKNSILLQDNALIDFQNFLIHLIPPALLKLYFFDGERIAEYLLDDQRNNVRDALMILSGNDTFDLMYTSVKKVLNTSVSEEYSITREYLQCKSVLKDLEMSRKQLSEEISELQFFQEEKKTEIEKLKKDYAAQGGISLDEWKELNTSLKTEEEKRERINWERKTMATDILPFLIAAPLLEQVRPQIAKEHEYTIWSALSSTIQTEEFKHIIIKSLSTTSNSNAKQMGNQLYEDIVQYLIPTNGWNQFEPLFGLSDDDEMSVQAVLNRVAQFDIKKISSYKKRIDSSISRAKEIREKLQNSSVDNYQAHVEAVSALNEEVFQGSLQLQSKETELRTCVEQIFLAEKRLSDAYKKLELDIKRRSVSTVSSNVVLLLENLQELIFDKLIKEVKRDTLSEIKRLLRKKRFIDDLEIDKDFRVHLLRHQIVEKRDIEKIYNRSGLAGVKRSLQHYAYTSLCDKLNIGEDSDELIGALKQYEGSDIELLMEINKDSLSNGEKQVFVMSLYWALMQQSKCDLPFIIDTPFARIDSEHRMNIVDNFFKKLNGQLFVLSTNEEIGLKHLEALSDTTSNVFLLEYSDNKCTRVIENKYFGV